MAEAEYRLNMVIKVFSDVIWYCTQISVFEVLFFHRPQISGWDILSMRVFMAKLLFAIDATYMILFHDNFEQASNTIRMGELDFLLVKPVNSQFMFSCRKVNAVYAINLAMVLGYLAWALSQAAGNPAGIRAICFDGGFIGLRIDGFVLASIFLCCLECASHQCR